MNTTGLWLRPSYSIYCRLLRVRGWALRRFTPAGLMVFAGLILAGMFGPDTDNNVAYQGFALFLGFLLLAVSFTSSFRPRLTVTRVLPRFGTVGAPLHYAMVLKSLSAKAEKDLTLLEELGDPFPKFQHWLALRRADHRRLRHFRLAQRTKIDFLPAAVFKPASVPVVPSGQELSLPAELIPLRRGPLRLESISLARTDPFGLLRALGRRAVPQTVLILPKRYSVPPAPLPGLLKYQQGGVALAANVGQSDEFVALRDYRHGDPLRHIHWRSWAKAGQPVVKEFEDEFFVRHALVLDTFSDHPGSDTFEEAVSVAASFACTIQTQESLLDLLFVGPDSYSFTAGRGLAQVDQLLEVLASVQPCVDQSFPTLEHLVLNHIHAVSGCICVLLAWDAERQNFVSKLKALGIPALVLVVTPPEPGELDPGPMRDDPAYFCVLEAGRIAEGLAKLV